LANIGLEPIGGIKWGIEFTPDLSNICYH